MKIHVVQPALPKYRIAFFEKLKKKFVMVFYSTEVDFLGVKTVYKPNGIKLSSGFLSFFNFFYWHKDLPLFTVYKKNDVVVINGNPRILNYMLLFILLRLRGVKTVWWGHGWSAGSHGLMAKMRIKLMKIASAVLVYTDYEKQQLEIPNCYALNNGLDSSEINKCINEVSAKKDFSQHSDEFYLLFIGRITEKANLTLLLNSLSATNKNIHLNIIGSGEESSRYQEMAKQLKLNERVHWYGALFDELEIAKVMVSSHAFIYTGSVGLSLIHAFNYGLPAIIHSDRSLHMPEFSVFKNNYNGLSFDHNSLLDLKDKINIMYNLTEQDYNLFSENAKHSVLESYNTDNMAFRFECMINESFL